MDILHPEEKTVVHVCHIARCGQCQEGQLYQVGVHHREILLSQGDIVHMFMAVNVNAVCLFLTLVMKMAVFVSGMFRRPTLVLSTDSHLPLSLIMSMTISTWMDLKRNQ